MLVDDTATTAAGSANKKIFHQVGNKWARSTKLNLSLTVRLHCPIYIRIKTYFATLIEHIKKIVKKNSSFLFVNTAQLIHTERESYAIAIFKHLRHG